MKIYTYTKKDFLEYVKQYIGPKAEFRKSLEDLIEMFPKNAPLLKEAERELAEFEASYVDPVPPPEAP